MTIYNEFKSLLEHKENLKIQVRMAKEKVKAQKKNIEAQRKRAENGQENTLVFEQKQLPIFISELQNIEKEYKNVKIKVKAFELSKNNPESSVPVTSELIEFEEWQFNSKNVFGFPDILNVPIYAIQYEIYNQQNSRNIKTIADYLGADIDVKKEIRLTQSLTIETIFKEDLGFENFNPFEFQKDMSCHLVLSYLQLSLLKEYTRKTHKNILPLTEYEKQYDDILNDFIASNIDTDEQDYIKAELVLCENLTSELSRPIYNALGIDKILENPCDFKKNLINSIDKRKKFLEQKQNEKTPKVKALFKFIEFLYSNIDNFKQYDELIKELKILDKERNNLHPRKNFKDKQKYDEIQETLKVKFKVVKENILQPIRNKVTELNICDIDNIETLWNWNISEISSLKENFSQKDLSDIFRHKRKYIEYRTKTNGENYFELQFFFNDLDEILKVLFDFFKETENNEFEPFENKPMQVDSISEAIKEFKKGKSSFVLLNSLFDNPIKNQQIQNETKLNQQTEKIKKLKGIWLPEAKITVENFIEMGIEKGIWDESLNLIIQKGSLYGTGKAALGSLSIALKGFTISNNTDYKKIGSVLCEVFEIKVNETTKEPYKAFSSGNNKLIPQFKRAFGIKNS